MRVKPVGVSWSLLKSTKIAASLCVLVLVMFSLSSRAEIVEPQLQGQWKQGALIYGHLPAGHRVTFLDRTVPVSAAGHFVLGLGRDFPKQASLVVENGSGESRVFHYPVEQRQYRIQKVNGVPARTVTPDPGHLARIRAEAKQAREARKQITPRQNFRQSFVWPLTGPITGVYGSQRYYNGEPRRPHFGVDVAAPTGTRVTAPAGGVVTLAHKDMFFSGGTLIVDHGHGLSSSFIHLSKLLVEVGQEINQGDVIAEVGATGRATGPHLDWRMNWFDQRVDPQLLVPPMPKKTDKNQALK
ncbi:M23 family metallopeptidase [Pseudomaricurvus alkylphenolicus]|uniref:M23 family metallopeptidase n=1 Tax=Pseudomaricurvus alkylphenolicus TaxID=1306991 RepID=UPI001423B25B|nr:M23 family metallopeptidase [Pseudomaricurvus alkylphenolicus]NIB43169.1 M23 family metallopeptidase [Pseudomaricurvus alkylphenolicus]